MTDDFATALAHHGSRLYKFALTRLRNTADAEDAVQHTLLRAWEYRAKFVPGTNLEAWLTTICKNVMSGAGAQAARRARWVAMVPDLEGAAEQSVEMVPHDGGVSHLEDAFAQLATAHQQVLGGALAGYTYEEMAERFGCSLGTIKSRTSRAREAFLAGLGGVR